MQAPGPCGPVLSCTTQTVIRNQIILMNRSNRQFVRDVVITLLGLSLGVAFPVVAKKPRPMDLECAVQTVVDRTGGKILAAEEVEEKNKRFFRIKVLTKQGRVRYVRISTDDKCEL